MNSTAQRTDRRGRVGKAWVPKRMPWQVSDWLDGEYPSGCRSNAESYPSPTRLGDARRMPFELSASRHGGSFV